MLSSILKLLNLSGILHPVIGAAAGFAVIYWFYGAPVSSGQVDVGADLVATCDANIILCIRIQNGPGTGACFSIGIGIALRVSFRFGIGI